VRIRIVTLATSIISLASCETDSPSSYLLSNTGNQGELLVVAPSAFWLSTDADLLREHLATTLPVLPAPERMFKPVEVKREGFADLFRTHRNILEIRLDPENETSIQPKSDVYSRQQCYVVVTLRKMEDLQPLIHEKFGQLLWLFHKAEVDRLISRNRSFGSKKLNDEVKQKTGINIVTQQDFIVAKSTSDFMWLRLDRQKPLGGYQHDILQGIAIFSRPYTDTNQYSDSSLFQWRDSITSAHIQGPGNSRMKISRKMYLPESNRISFHKQTACEVRGLWRMEGEEGVFMGGPFYSLVFFNPTNKRQYMIDGYVYAPQFDKAPLIREVEAIAKSAVPN
jgi:hypothetical protein